MTSQVLSTLHHCVFRITLHMVLVTKYRRKALTAPILTRMKEITEALLASWNCELLEFNGEEDHVHILLAIHPAIQPSKAVNSLKTVTARRLRKEFAAHFRKHYWSKPALWSRSYCLLSAGGAPLEVLKRYIQSQDAPE